MTAAAGARNLFKVDASVVHALLQARYYDGSKGEFLSEDPAFLAVGSPAQLQQLSNQDQSQFLMDPQQMNSYSYASDNPITKSDPNGRQAVPIILVALEIYGYAQLSIDGYDFYQTNFKYGDVFSSQEKAQTNFKTGYDLLTLGAGSVAGKVGLPLAGKALNVLGAGQDTLDQYYNKQIYSSDNQLHRDKTTGAYKNVDLLQLLRTPSSVSVFTQKTNGSVQSSASAIPRVVGRVRAIY